MYYFYGKVNRGHVACPLYGGCPYLGVSIMGGSTVSPNFWCIIIYISMCLKICIL